MDGRDGVHGWLEGLVWIRLVDGLWGSWNRLTVIVRSSSAGVRYYFIIG